MKRTNSTLQELLRDLSASSDKKDKAAARELKKLLDEDVGIETPLGTIMVHPFIYGESRDLFVDLVTSDGIVFPLTCTAYSKEDNDIVTKLWTGTESDNLGFDRKDQHNLMTGRFRSYIRDFLRVYLGEVFPTEEVLSEATEEALNLFLKNRKKWTLNDACNEVIARHETK